MSAPKAGALGPRAIMAASAAAVPDVASRDLVGKVCTIGIPSDYYLCT